VSVVAVHDMGLEKALRRLGIYERLVKGAMCCMICEGFCGFGESWGADAC